MPIKRRTLKRRVFDELKLAELIDGPGTCLLAGYGYYLAHSGPEAVAGEVGGFFWELTPRGQEIVLERMRADWEQHHSTVSAMVEGKSWAERQFGKPAASVGGNHGAD